MKPPIKGLLILFAVVLLLVVMSGSVLAVEQFSELDQALNQQQQQPEMQPNNLILNFIKLVLVLGLITGAVWAIIKLFGHQVGIRMQGNWLHIVDEVMLGQNKGIVLCEISDKIYALGVTENQITKLFEIEDAQLIEKIKTQEHEQDHEVQLLKPFLKGQSSSFLNKRKEKNFHQLMQEQIQKAKGFEQDYPRKRSDADE